jgi:hypothetical protein
MIGVAVDRVAVRLGNFSGLSEFLHSVFSGLLSESVGIPPTVLLCLLMERSLHVPPGSRSFE